MRSRLGVALGLSLLAGLALPTVALAIGTLDQAEESAAGGTCALTDSPGEYRPVAQLFTAGLTGDLDTVSLWPGADWSAQGVTVQIRTVAGLVPSSTILASQTWTSSISGQFVNLTFGAPASIASGVQYAIVVARSAGVNGLAWGCVGNTYSGGHSALYLPGTTTWEAQTSVDRAFRTYVSVAFDVQVYLSGIGEGANGSVSSSPAGIDCGATCLAQFIAGSQVTLTAHPVVTASFGYWQGGPCDQSHNAVCSFTMPAQNVETNANFYGIEATSPPGPTATPGASHAATPRPTAAASHGASPAASLEASGEPSVEPLDSGSASVEPESTPGPSATPTTIPGEPTADGGGSILPILLGLVVLAALIGGGGFFLGRRRSAGGLPPAGPPEAE